MNFHVFSLTGIIRDTVAGRLDVYSKLDEETEHKIRAAIEAATLAMKPVVTSSPTPEEANEAVATDESEPAQPADAEANKTVEEPAEKPTTDEDQGGDTENGGGDGGEEDGGDEE